MKQRLVVVIPVYNEEAVLPEMISRLRAVMSGLSHLDCEVLFIDDGSHDRTGEILATAHREDRRFTWIRFSRNFGLQSALTAGLAETDADATVFIDGDLQDPPELISRLVERWEKGFDVVLASRKSRKERGLRGLLLRLFHLLQPHFSGLPASRGTGNFGLLSRRAAGALKSLPERNRYFPGLRAWVGFKVETVEYDRQERSAGAPKQSLRRLLNYAADALFSFSYFPLRVLTASGALISIIGFSTGLHFSIKRLLGLESAFTGFTTLVVLVVCLGGFQLIALGVIGEYLLRIYDEVKGRPPYIVDARSGAEPEQPTESIKE